MIPLTILPQPDDTTCGPTSLHAVYRYFHFEIPLQKLITEIKWLQDGGTLAVYLGIDALNRGFNATIYSYNLKIFDPTWDNLTNEKLIFKLEEQLKYKKGLKFEEASMAYIQFLKLGGKLFFQDLTTDLLKSYFDKQVPILTGLSATYLYNCKREFTNAKKISVFDDLKGYPMGHFVVLCGVDEQGMVSVADPYKENPISLDHYYHVNANRLINAIMLGIVTYDANMLIIEPKVI
jgi:hypothetical protein